MKKNSSVRNAVRYLMTGSILRGINKYTRQNIVDLCKNGIGTTDYT